MPNVGFVTPSSLSSTRKKQIEEADWPRATKIHFPETDFFLPSAFPAIGEAVENTALSLFNHFSHSYTKTFTSGQCSTQIWDPLRIFFPSSSFVCFSVPPFWCICGVKFNSVAYLAHKIHKGHPEKNKIQVFFCPQNLILCFRDEVF